MITISENQTKKMPGNTSLFIQFPYNSEIVDAIKTIDIAMWHKDIMAWEVPIIYLSELLDKICVYDDITLTWLPEKTCEKDITYELQEYKTKPLEHQIEGIQYGLNHDKFLLLDQPGLGKTLQLTYIAEELKQRENLEHCLVICGVNTLKTNWKAEIAKHSNLSARILGEKYTKKGKLKIGTIAERLEDLKHPINEFFVITNIETIRNDDIVKAINEGKHNKFDMIVLDEAHVCKNPQSSQGKNLLKLNKAKHIIGATGTLLMNDPCDLYVPLKWIGNERSTMSNFSYFYTVYGGPFHNDVVGYKNLKYLQNQLAEVSLRRTKDILHLPPKNIIHEFVEMEPAQRKFYEDVKKGIVDEVDKVELTPACVLGMVTRLRQVTADPTILTSENIASAKIERACDLAEQICSNGDKVVIFSNFKPTAQTIYNKLLKYHPLLNTGDNTDAEIETNKSLFQNDDKHKIFIATWQKCGTGITLTRASYMIFVDCAWTESQNGQCEDRIYRIGTEKPVFIYYLWTTDSIDERVKDIVETKGLLSDYVVDGECPPQLANKLKEIILDL